MRVKRKHYHRMSLTWETRNHFKMLKNWSVKSDHIPKWIFCACAGATDECGFDLKKTLSTGAKLLEGGGGGGGE